MSDQEPLPPELQALLDAERESPGIPAAVHRRMRDRLATAIAVRAATGDGPPPGGAAAPGSPVAAAGKLLARKILVGVATFAVGAVVGVGADSAYRRSHAVSAVTAPPLIAAPSIAAPSIAPSVPVAVPAAPPLAVKATPPRPLERPAPSLREPRTGRDTELAAERALIETARAALSHGDGAGAIDALDRHGQRFPHGRLVEERESLAVQALVIAERYDEARVRAARFRKRFADSMLLPSVEAALQSIP